MTLFRNRIRNSWLLVAGWAVVILTGTSVPGSGLEGIWTPRDKLMHFAGYLPLGFLLYRALALTARSSAKWVLAGIALGAGSLFALLDELHQKFIPGRSYDTADWIADVCGLAAGIAVALATERIWRKEVSEYDRSDGS